MTTKHTIELLDALKSLLDLYKEEIYYFYDSSSKALPYLEEKIAHYECVIQRISDDITKATGESK